VALAQIRPAGCAPQGTFTGHNATVNSVRFDPDGATLVTASLDETARVWRADGALLATLAGHRARVGQAEFSPDGRWVLTGSRDGALRLWRAPDGATGVLDQPFLTIAAGLRGVTGIAFSPDGNQVLAGYWANAAQLWRLWSEESPPPDRLETWGPERARLALIREAEAFRFDNRLDTRPRIPPEAD
jgi:WD40 repeat protein